MSDQKIIEQYKLLKTAKKLETMGNAHRALELYLELHEKYEPNTSDAYERPIILLERFKRYTEALKLCEEAIEEIKNDRISGTLDKFEKLKQSIQSKLEDTPIENQAEEHYVFGLIGFRSHILYKQVIASVVYLFFLLTFYISPFAPLAFFSLTYGFTYFIDILQTKGKHKLILTFLSMILFTIAVFSLLQLPSAIQSIIEPENNKEALDNGADIFMEKDELPEIKNKHIRDAVTIVKNEIEVKDALIIVNGSEVTFGLLLDPNTPAERAEKITDTFVRALAHRVSQDEPITAPTENNLGALYDYYSIVVSAGSDNDQIILKGTKTINDSEINYR
ncbi:MAG: hypothetical protein JXR88_15930 [Clostridia bacterium]|nr:hypothetical protein [Clostridia bacterium]